MPAFPLSQHSVVSTAELQAPMWSEVVLLHRVAINNWQFFDSEQTFPLPYSISLADSATFKCFLGCQYDPMLNFVFIAVFLHYAVNFILMPSIFCFIVTDLLRGGL